MTLYRQPTPAPGITPTERAKALEIGEPFFKEGEQDKVALAKRIQDAPGITPPVVVGGETYYYDKGRGEVFKMVRWIGADKLELKKLSEEQAKQFLLKQFPEVEKQREMLKEGQIGGASKLTAEYFTF